MSSNLNPEYGRVVLDERLGLWFEVKGCQKIASSSAMEVGSGFLGRVRVGPGFGPYFPKKNRAQSRTHWLIIFVHSDIFLKTRFFYAERPK